MLEIISIKIFCRIVVNYGDRAEMVLLAMRHIATGHYASQIVVDAIALAGQFQRPTVYNVTEPEGILALCATLDANQEGFVAEFADGQHFKFKGSAYVELHRLLAGITFKNTLQAVATGRVEEFKAAIPDEFLGQFRDWVAEINAWIAHRTAQIEEAFGDAPKSSRKDFAAWVNENCDDIAPYLFLKYEGRDYVPLIYKREFKD